ncbi:MAG: hypothetical protein C0459_15050 [Chitinophaga sp.]|nr:hypothetical protein [Chitinophaga sp.]
MIQSFNIFNPVTVYALTSGPSQPEMQKFQPAGVNDMVDLFTGDFKNNIPLLDVGGYPLNLTYQSGSNFEEEAGWVGIGWSLSPGAVNRNLKGIPDDFNGDKTTKIYDRKEYKKVGGSLVLKSTLFGWELGHASLKLNVYKDNRYGIGASVSASVSAALSQSNQSNLTAGLNLNSDVRGGVSLTPSLSLDIPNETSVDRNKGSLSGSLMMNTRQGLKELSLSASFNCINNDSYLPLNLESSTSYGFNHTYYPSSDPNKKTYAYNFNFDIGPKVWPTVPIGLGVEGYWEYETIDNASKNRQSPSYGFINYLNGKANSDALIDFNREKDNVFLMNTPALATPVLTQDIFTASSQYGSYQFKPTYGSVYVGYDRDSYSKNDNKSLGISVGVAATSTQWGGRYNQTDANSSNGAWRKNNQFTDNKANLLFNDYPSEKYFSEPVYFKMIGEKGVTDYDFNNQIGNEQVKKIGIANGTFLTGTYATEKLLPNDPNTGKPIKRQTRGDIRNTNFSYLNALDASGVGLDKFIKNKVFDTNTNDYTIEINTPRLSSQKKGHHISEVTVTDNEGKRLVYGLPVYNITQEEATFSIATPNNIQLARKTGIVNYTINSEHNYTPDLSGDKNTAYHKFGRDELYSKEITPPYATSFLITGILSPDYVDLTDNGITDDDLGTAIKFSYKNITTSKTYKWRSPYLYEQANYNEGYISDKKDDKASYVYGEKEVWYPAVIQSKTQIAIFYTSNREDALGVIDNRGGQDASLRLQKLDSIRLFSKADYYKNGANNAIPIKVVHFEYDYSTYPNLPNNSGATISAYGISNINVNKGKLTLKKLYFTFGTNTRGTTNPYKFEYDNRLVSSIQNSPANNPSTEESNDYYTTRQTDRWGNYKQSFYNTGFSNTQVFNNSEFPYTLQENQGTAFSERELNNILVSKWQLNKITTPTGSIINIEYESDDYAYVQNKRAMQMCFVTGIGSNNNNVGLIDATDLIVQLPLSVSSDDEFKRRYLEGVSNIFYKFYADVDNKGHYEFINGYAEIDAVNSGLVSGSNNRAIIKVKPISGNNPIALQGWQMLKEGLPQYAYDNYDNTDVGNDAQAAIVSVIQSIANLKELVEPYTSRSRRKQFSDKVQLNKCLIRLNNPDYKKMGGGSRVHKITISDQWQATGTNLGVSFKNGDYGLLYDYTTTDNNILDNSGNPIKISSGVASYEPQIGNEENPFHQPVTYTEKIMWGNDKNHIIEKPYCESYFPSPQVGYTKVTVINIGVNNAQETGFVENEFYSTKEFPILVDNTTIETNSYDNDLILRLFSSTSIHRVGATQGFKVELNDMNGKQKSVKTFDKNHNLISSTENFYSLVDADAELKQLNNELPVLNKDGSIENRVIATDMEFVVDSRENRNDQLGISVGGYFGFFWISIFGLPIPIPYGATSNGPSYSIDVFNSMSAVKLIHKYGVLKKVKTIQNGSSIEVENLLWDKQTGEVLLTKTQNEFDNYTYSFHYPAYMVTNYEGMAAAFHNIGALVADITTDNNGIITSTGWQSLFPGDELANYSYPQQRAWVIKSYDGTLRLIDKTGAFVSNVQGVGSLFKILRSGRRNMLSASAGTIVTMVNPIVNNNHLDFSADKKILDAKAILYNEKWGIPSYCLGYDYYECQIVNGGQNSGGSGGVNYFDINEYFAHGPSIAFNNQFNKADTAPLQTFSSINNPPTISTCTSYPVINPYIRNILGNWKPQASYVYTTNRTQLKGILSQNGGTDIRNSGYYTSFNPFWTFTSSGLRTDNNSYDFTQTFPSNDNRWVWNSRSVHFDQNGNEVESVDALNRFSSALYGYKQTLSTAVAANARRNEIAFDGFEDYNFNMSGSTCELPRHINWDINANHLISNEKAHSGKYSLKLINNNELVLSRNFGSSSPESPSFLNYGTTGKYILTSNEQINGFAPIPGKKYILSFWVNDGQSSNNKIQNLQLKINNNDLSIQNTIVKVVEGWKKIDVEFTAQNINPSVTISLKPTGGNIYIDDIRIYPKDGQMKSFVYNDQNLRLVSQLDENNFATFYEYDEEGTPIRVKKETERGIMTIKESRKYFKQ